MVIRSAQQGLVLIPVLISLAIIAAVVHFLNLQQGMLAQSNAKKQDTEVANALAEAGLRDALWRARKSSTYPNPLRGTLTGFGDYRVFIFKDTDNVRLHLVSEGVTANNTQRTLRRTYSLVCPNGTTTTTIAKYAAGGNPTNIVEGSTNNLQNGYLHPRNNASARVRSLIKFDYGTDVPAGATIVSATLMLDVQQHDPAMEGATLIANRVIQTWTDKDATWLAAQFKKAWQSPDKTGGHFTLVDEGSTTIAAGTITYSINITGIMKAWVSGSTNDGLILRTDGITTMGPSDFRLRGPSGSTTTHWPRIEVKWC